MKKSDVVLHRIFLVVANHYDLSVGQMMSGNKARVFSEPRMISMYLAVKLLPFENSKSLGFKMGVGKADFWRASKAVNEWLGVDQHIKATVEKLWEKLKPTSPEWQSVASYVPSNGSVRLLIPAAIVLND